MITSNQILIIHHLCSVNKFSNSVFQSRFYESSPNYVYLSTEYSFSKKDDLIKHSATFYAPLGVTGMQIYTCLCQLALTH